MKTLLRRFAMSIGLCSIAVWAPQGFSAEKLFYEGKILTTAEVSRCMQR